MGWCCVQLGRKAVKDNGTEDIKLMFYSQFARLQRSYVTHRSSNAEHSIGLHHLLETLSWLGCAHCVTHCVMVAVKEEKNDKRHKLFYTFLHTAFLPEPVQQQPSAQPPPPCRPLPKFPPPSPRFLTFYYLGRLFCIEPVRISQLPQCLNVLTALPGCPPVAGQGRQGGLHVVPRPGPPPA